MSMSWLIIGIPGSQHEQGLIVCPDVNQAFRKSVQEESFVKTYVGDPMKKENKVPVFWHVFILFQ